MEQPCCKQMLDLVMAISIAPNNPSMHPYASTWIGACTLTEPKFSLWWKTKVCSKRAWECSNKS